MNKLFCRVTLKICAVAVIAGCSIKSSTPPEVFQSPEGAVSRLAAVVDSGDVVDAQKLFGSEGEYLLNSGDQALDKARATRFSEMFKERHELRAQAENRYVMLLGSKGWPFPVPLVKQGPSWMFDASAGREEVLSRRIGENEFSTLDTARAIYHAQRRYAAQDWNGDGEYQYAERLISTPGNKEGLYWPQTDQNEEPSPLDSVIAKAAEESYVITPGGEPQPFHGYYYKLKYTPVLGDEKLDVLSRPGKYWLFATPAVWNETGVMTFALNERGWIYEKDLGDDVNLSSISDEQVDESWTRVE
jgi:hypothetical protein